LYQVQNWLTEQQIDAIQYSAYWNDEDQERSKVWYILDNDFSKMERYLEKTNFKQDLLRAEYELNKKFKKNLSGIGIDLAAGNLWAVPSLLSIGNIVHLYCLEISRHRLLKLGPVVLKHYAVPDDKVTLVLGSFYDLKLEDQSIDFCFMSAAFHHADDPNRLLKEVWRVLKSGGVAIIIGEPVVYLLQTRIKHLIKFLLTFLLPDCFQEYFFGKSFKVTNPFPKTTELLSPDPVLGDHDYFLKDYYRMFSENGFLQKRLKSKNASWQSFLLVKR
jgi:ubiquinone/menaquinone biosynthesis C-methylase UbiE